MMSSEECDLLEKRGAAHVATQLVFYSYIFLYFHDFYRAIPVILKTPCNMDLYVFAIALCVLILTPLLGFSVKVDFSTNINEPIRYTAEELRTMKPRPCHLANDDILNLDLPYEMRRRKRGKAGGVRKRLKTLHILYQLHGNGSCIIPVPKKPIITCMNDLRPVALTSVAMKYNLVSWGGNIRKEDAHPIDVLIRQASRTIGDSQPTLASSYQHQLGVKLEKILLDEDHPVCEFLDRAIIPRSGRMRLPLARTNRHPSSFIPQCMK
ncbi:hypothetical protein BSL78_13570 [Apostichopus japonicus]|uniref:Uncharacterized protein n=1 Tax=Stichopus japonicus TaxID=307972 RepID=A0A2G8KNG5_STIJA|nr:hypothetical protein BSL78_13570 [Apostichopus japonicus]